MTRLVPRLIEPRLRELMSELPAVSIVGARATGKTTLAKQVAKTVIQLDRGAEAAAFVADPDVALRGMEEPVLLDEWQEVPEILGAVKRAVDEDSRPGRFLLTGSAHANVETRMWPGTGRLVRMRMHGLIERELEGSGNSLFLERLRGAEVSALTSSGAEDLRSYTARAIRGGFPGAALRLSSRARGRWLESYAEELVARDASQLRAATSTQKLGRYLSAVAVNAAGVVSEQTLFEAAGVNRKSAQAYEVLLSRLFVLDVVPAWHSNRLSRLLKTPKRYLSDSSLVAAIGHMSVDSVLRDGDALGRILDNFVFMQISAERDLMESPPQIYHLRDTNGRHEIDIVVEFGNGKVAGIEVKATAAPRPRDARHLEWLRDELGDRFVAGVVLHTGPRVFPLSDRIAAAPISTLWST